MGNRTLYFENGEGLPSGRLILTRPGRPYRPTTGPQVTSATDARGRTLPPAEFVAASAPCESCQNTTGSNIQHGDFITGDFHLRWDLLTCPDCRIELVGPCPYCAVSAGFCLAHNITGSRITLGYAYAVGQPCPLPGRKWALELNVCRVKA